jgi:hypothetical protein
VIKIKATTKPAASISGSRLFPVNPFIYGINLAGTEMPFSFRYLIVPGCSGMGE